MNITSIHGDLSHAIDPLNPDNQIDQLLSGDAIFPEETPPKLEQWVFELQQKTHEAISLNISDADFLQSFLGIRARHHHQHQAPMVVIILLQ